MSVCAIMSRLNLCFKEYLNELKDRSWRYNVLRPSAMFIKAKWLIPFENNSMYHLQVHKKDLFEMVKSSGQEVFFVHIYDLIRISNIRFLTYKCNYAHKCDSQFNESSFLFIFCFIWVYIELNQVVNTRKNNQNILHLYSMLMLQIFFFLSFIMLLLSLRTDFIHKSVCRYIMSPEAKFFFSFNIVQ